MISSFKVRELFEHCGGNSHRGRVAMENKIHNFLGLSDEHGNRYKDRWGNAILKDPVIDPSQFSVKEIAEGIFGSGASNLLFNQDHAPLVEKIRARTQELREAGITDRRALMESAGMGIDPTAFLNTNLFTGVVGGLVEVRILQGFNDPQFIMDRVFKTETTKQNGGKIIGVTPFGDVAKKRLPGEAHPTASNEERYVTTPETYENALAVHVKKETVFYDLTGNILREASNVGKSIRLRKELECIDVFTGITNPFNFMGTARNTYVTSRTEGYLNDHSNAFLDWVSLNTAEQLFNEMQDPKTGLPIAVNPNLLVCMPAKKNSIQYAVNAIEVGQRTGTGATTPQTTSNPLITMKSQGNPYAGRFEVLSSPLLYKRATDADGLNLSASNAKEYWWMTEAGGEDAAFWYLQNYPLQTTQATPTSWNMLNNGLVASYFSNQRGVPTVVYPWKTVRNKN